MTSIEHSLMLLTGIYKRYPHQQSDEEAPWTLNNINFQVPAGASVAIIGPSGSGKSTLLNIMGTLDRPTTGQVLFEGNDLSQMNDGQLASIRNQRIGFIFQLHHLLPQCTLLENVLLPTLARKGHRTTREAESRARQLLERVGLAQRLSYRPGQLSGGECQRAAVVRALINEPTLLLADEPTGSLDHAAAQNLSRLLVELNQEKQVALIVVTHSIELASQMKKIYQLRNGVLKAYSLNEKQ